MKTLLGSLIGVIVTALIAAVVIAFIFWARIPDIVSNHLSSKLGVGVTIDDVSLRWGKLQISDVQVGNPPNAILAKAFAAQEIDILTPLSSYLKQHIQIEEIDVNNVYLGLEFNSATTTNGNWTEIMAHLKASSDRDARAEAASHAKKRTVLIRRLVLTNIDVDVVYRKEGGRVQKLPRIPRMEFTNISSEGGIPTNQIMNSVLGQMLKGVFEKQNLKNMLDNLFNQQSPIQKYVQPFRGLFNAAPHKEEQGTQKAA